MAQQSLLQVAFQAEDRGLGNYIDSLTGMLGAASGQVRDFLGAFTGTAGAIRYIQSALGAYNEFNRTLARAAAVSNATEAEFKLLSETALELGRVTEYAASDVAGAMREMALAGFSVNEIISASPGLLAMATSGAVQITQATQIAGQTLRSFHIEANKMNYVSGVLTATFSSTNTRLQDLDFTIRYAGASAAELGTRLSEVAAAAGILGNVGIRGSMSGTGLRQMMDQLAASLGGNQDQMSRSASALKQLGIQWSDVTDEFGNLSIVKSVEALEHSFDKMGSTAEQRIKMLRPIFGIRAASQVTALVSQGSEVLRAKELETAFGGAKQQLIGFIGQATQLPDGIRGLKLDSIEMADNFVTVGEVGERNLERIGTQMRELGLTGGLLNSQIGLTRERVQQLDGKVIRDRVFTPINELNSGTLRAIDGLIRLKEHLSGIASEAERAAIIEEIFGADARMVELATAAFRDGGQAMQDFANQMMRANSALDVQKKQLDTLYGSLELLSSATDTIRTNVGELLSPVVRVAALAMASVTGLLTSGNTITSQLAEFQDNLGGIERHIQDIMTAWNRFSFAGQLAIVVAGLSAMLALLSTIAFGLTTILSPITAILSALGTGGVLGILSSIVAIGAPLLAIFGMLAGSITNGSEELQSFGEIVAAVSGASVANFRNLLGLGAQLGRLGTIFSGMATSARNLITGIDGAAPALLDDVLIQLNYLGSAAEGSRRTIQTTFTNLIRMATNASNSIRGVADNIGFGDNVFSGFGETSSRIMLAIFQGIEEIDDVLSLMWTNVGNMLKNMFSLSGLFWGALASTALRLLPTIWELVKGIHRSFMDLGNLHVMPQVTAKMAFESGPSGGLLTTFVSEFKTAANGLVWIAALITDVLMRAFYTVLETAISVASALIGIITQTIIGIPRAFYTAMAGLYEIIENALGAVFGLAGEFIVGAASILIQRVILAIQSAAAWIVGAVLLVVNTIVESIKTLVFTFPTMIINTILKIYAAVIRFLSNFALFFLNLSTQLLVNLMRSVRSIIYGVSELVVIVATLPVSFPYLAYLAVKRFVSTFIGQLGSGMNAIGNALSGLMNGLVAIAKTIWREFVATIVTPIRAAVYAVVDVMRGIIMLPVIVGGIVWQIFDYITSVVEHIFNYLATTLWDIPDYIESVILRVFSLMSDILGFIMEIISKIFFGIIDAITRYFNLVYRLILGFFVYLPLIILRSIGQAIRGIIVGFENFVINAYLMIVSFVVGIINNFITNVILQFREAYAWIADFVPEFMDMLRSLFDMLYEDITSAVDYVFTQLPQDVIASLNEAVEWLTETVIEMPGEVADTFIDAIENITDTIIDTVEEMFSFLENLGTQDFPEAMFAALDGFIVAIAEFPERFFNAVGPAIARVGDALQRAWARLLAIDWTALGAKIQSAFSALLTRIRAGLVRVFNSLVDLPVILVGLLDIIRRRTLAWFGQANASILPAIGTGIKNAIAALITGILNLITGVKSAWEAFLQRLQAVFGTTDFGAILILVLNSLYNAIYDWAGQMITDVSNIINNLQKRISSATSGTAWAGVGGVLIQVLDYLRTGLVFAFRMVREGARIASGAMTMFIQRFGDVTGALKAFILGGLGLVVVVASPALWALKAIAAMIWNLIKAASSGILALGATIDSALSSVEGKDLNTILEKVFDTLRDYAANNGWALLGDIIDLTITAMTYLATVVAGMLATFIVRFIGVLWNHFGAIGKVLAAIFGTIAIVSGVFLGLAYVISLVLAPVLQILIGTLLFFGRALLWVVQTVGSLAATIGNFFINIILGVENFGETILGTLWDFMGTALDNITEFIIGGIGGVMQQGFSEILDSMYDWIRNSRLANWVLGTSQGNAAGGATNAAAGAAGTPDIATMLHNLGVPGFAEGGVVTGETLATVGEKGPEAILPLSALGGMLGAIGGGAGAGRSIGKALSPIADTMQTAAATFLDSTKKQRSAAEQFRDVLERFKKGGLGIGGASADSAASTASKGSSSLYGIGRIANGFFTAITSGPEILKTGADALKGTWNAVSGLFGKTGAAMPKQLLLPFEGAIETSGAAGTSFLTRIGTTFSTFKTQILESIMTFFTRVKGLVLGAIRIFGPFLAALAFALVKFILIQMAIDAVIWVLDKLSKRFLGMPLGDALLAAWEIAKNFFSSLGTWISEWAGIFWDTAKGTLSDIWSGVKAIGQFVAGMLGAVWDILKRFFLWSTSWISGLGLAFRAVIYGIIVLAKYLATWVSPLFSLVKGLASLLLNSIVGTFKGVWGLFKGLGGLFGRMGSGLGSLSWKSLFVNPSEAGPAIKAFGKGLLQGMSSLGSSIFTYLKGPILGILNFSKGAILFVGRIAVQVIGWLLITFGPLIATQLAIEALIWALDALSKEFLGIGLWDLLVEMFEQAKQSLMELWGLIKPILEKLGLLPKEGANDLNKDDQQKAQSDLDRARELKKQGKIDEAKALYAKYMAANQGISDKASTEGNSYLSFLGRAASGAWQGTKAAYNWAAGNEQEKETPISEYDEAAARAGYAPTIINNNNVSTIVQVEDSSVVPAKVQEALGKGLNSGGSSKSGPRPSVPPSPAKDTGVYRNNPKLDARNSRR